MKLNFDFFGFYSIFFFSDVRLIWTIISDYLILNFCNLGATSFDRLGHGSFLKFVTENKNLNRMLEFGTATSADVIGTKVTKEELIHFVIQCGGGRKKVQKSFTKFLRGAFSL